MFLRPPTNFNSRETYLKERMYLATCYSLNSPLDSAEFETDIVESAVYVYTTYTHVGFIETQ